MCPRDQAVLIGSHSARRSHNSLERAFPSAARRYLPSSGGNTGHRVYLRLEYARARLRPLNCAQVGLWTLSTLMFKQMPLDRVPVVSMDFHKVNVGGRWCRGQADPSEFSARNRADRLVIAAGRPLPRRGRPRVYAARLRRRSAYSACRRTGRENRRRRRADSRENAPRYTFP